MTVDPQLEDQRSGSFLTDKDGVQIVTGRNGAAIPVEDSSGELRFGGGKTAVVATVTASGPTTIHTPAAGQKIQLYWISAINDPDEATSPLIKVKLGGVELYRVYAVAHWELFVGPTDGTLVVDLSSAASVAVTAHIMEAV